MIEEYKIFKNTYNTNTGHGSLWEVSNLGNIKRNGEPFEPYLHGRYLCFCSGYGVHRAVAELFISNTENKPTVDHIDRNPFNNRIDNLRWSTYSEQNQNRKYSDDGRKRLSEAFKGLNKGKTHSQETKQKISEALKGKRKGISLTEEHKQHIKDAIAKNPNNHKIPDNKGRKKVWIEKEQRYRMIKQK